MFIAKSMRFVVVASFALSLAACQTTGDRNRFGSSGPAGSATSADYPMTSAEKQLAEDNQIYNETIFGGAATGAVAGALLGALVGFATGDARNAAIYAGVGAVGGGLVGGLDGYMVAKKQEAARAKVREIQLVTRDVEAENDRIAKSIANMDLVIAQTRSSLEQGRKDFKSGKINAVQAKKTEDRAKRNLTAVDGLISGMETRNKEYTDVSKQLKAQGENTAQLDKQIADARTQIERKKKERDLLAQDLEQGRIG
ncbi:hypothetical protein CKO38_16030 [Rhodospirillum rubrum]|nr:hypothetical protein [Rhodospirillum rubrum]MBK1678152.1 hypothetical protein [Rhodospirillum rubrum]